METHPVQPQLSLRMSAWVFLAGWDEAGALPPSPPSVQMHADFLEGLGSREGGDEGGGEKRIAPNKKLCVKRIFKCHLIYLLTKSEGFGPQEEIIP